MVESTEVRSSDDFPETVFDQARIGRIARETHMRAGFVVERVDRLPPIAKL